MTVFFKLTGFFSLWILMAYSIASEGSDELRELNYADEIHASLAIGNEVWLKAGGHRFLSLYTETDQAGTLGAVLLLHAMGGHPNQAPVIRSLRTYFPHHHWATLALQLPLMNAGEKAESYAETFAQAQLRIQAGINYLNSQGIQQIVIVGYGMGGMMATDYLANNQSSPIKALVAISLSVPDSDKKQLQVIKFIRKIKRPFLDIYAEFDLLDVVSTARQRRIAAKQNPFYRQVNITTEDHFFRHDEGLLVKRIYSWVNRL